MKYYIKDKPYPVIVEKKKIKHAYLLVNDNLEIVIRINKYASQKMIESLVNENRVKIDKMILKQEAKQKQDQYFYYFGQKYDVVLGNCFEEVSFDGNKIYTLSLKQLDDYVFNSLKNKTEEYVNYYYNQIIETIPYPHLKYRKMKTRWGVCNLKNETITINKELSKKEEWALEYVVVHELVHFIHNNHSKEYWQLVAKYYPNYKKVRNYLKN